MNENIKNDHQGMSTACQVYHEMKRGKEVLALAVSRLGKPHPHTNQNPSAGTVTVPVELLRVRILAWASKMGSWPARPLQSIFAARVLTQMLYWTSGISSAPRV
eukprot:s1674_g15.t1